MRDRHHAIVLSLAIVGAVLARPRTAEACGCLSPPAVSSGEYAVNQSAEQIIFETEPGWVTAHVLIKYAGDPSKFAWIIPVPEVPELAISPVSIFGLLDQLTGPDVTASLDDICPISEWACAYHEAPHCGGFGGEADYGASGLADAGASSSDAPGQTGVDIISEQVVGDYQTVTFRASEASLAVQWLRDNGFIVNQTTSIYMESYVNANMVFVAAKLVPGAGVKAIKPLKLRYRAAFPMIPLILTAVAAEPHLTVSAFIYGNKPFKPMGHPVVTINSDRIAQDPKQRLNYPMVLARTIDEAGGDGFAIEYRGWPVSWDPNSSSPCCYDGYDRCNIGHDNQCQCPTQEFDYDDCSRNGDLPDGAKLLNALAGKYQSLTRITTRVSAEEMTFDPQFEPDYTGMPIGRMTVRGRQPSLAACETQVIDKTRFNEIDAKQSCASVYCGVGSQCVITQAGPGCACAAGAVAQMFTDLDGKPSVTCVPKVPPVDLRAGGLTLPDACAGVTCGSGTCIDRNGVAVCECGSGAGAIAGATTPYCAKTDLVTSSPGAEDFSEPMRYLDVCAPRPPVCGDGGWLIKAGSPRPGVDCGGTQPLPIQTTEPPKPTCGFWGCGCQGTPSTPLTGMLMSSFVLVLILRRRR